MNRRWMMIAGAVLLAVLVGVVAYNAGLDRGIEQSGKMVAAPYPDHWHHHGFPGYFLFPLFVVGMLLLFRGRHRHYACAHDHDPDRGR